jgi:large subunit ribosomal protein L25
MRSIDAVVRQQRGNTRKNQRLRDNGRLPGVLYGVDEDKNVVKMNLTVDTKAVNRELRALGDSIENTIYELNVVDESTGETTTHAVLPRQIPLNPISDEPMSVNFLKYWPGQFVRIPLTYINADQSVDLKRGCFLLRTSWFLECIVDSADPAHMPKSLEVDLTGTVKGDALRLQHIVFPPFVRPSHRVPEDFVAAVVKKK